MSINKVNFLNFKNYLHLCCKKGGGSIDDIAQGYNIFYRRLDNIRLKNYKLNQNVYDRSTQKESKENLEYFIVLDNNCKDAVSHYETYCIWVCYWFKKYHESVDVELEDNDIFTKVTTRRVSC